MNPPALEQGLRLQAAELRRRLAAGMPRAGWKVCVNDGRMQKKLGLDGCFAGFLDGSRALRSGDAWKVEEGSILGVEPELAIRFRAGVAAGDPAEAIRRAIEGVAPAIEVVDWKGAKLDLESLAASSSFHAGFVVGELRGLDDVPEIGPDCPLFRRGDEILGVPDPSLVPSDLAVLVSRVAACLAGIDEEIRAGDTLIGGACTNPGRVEDGDEVEADFGRLGRVSVRFVA
jgi:2-keto-4-pentenoate hydratase